MRGEEGFDDSVQRFQLGALVPLPHHLTPAEVLGVLLEGSQLRQGIVADQKLGQYILGCLVQRLSEQVSQTPALSGQCFADQVLQRRVAWPDDPLYVEVGDQFGDDKAGCDIAPNDSSSLACEFGEKIRRP